MTDELPESEELDYRTIASLLNEWDEEFMKNGDDWHAPGEWWSQRIGKLSIRVETKAQMEAMGLDD